MNEGSRIEAVVCRDCNRQISPETRSRECPACGGTLRAVWNSPDAGTAALDGNVKTIWDYENWLPFDSRQAVSLGEGRTPLVSSQTIANEIGVESVYIKDEGQNPTGSAVDRDMSLAMTAAAQFDVTRGALAAPGAAGQSFAAYAARAGIEGSVYLPSRAPFDRKAMVNVHGIDLTVVRGRFEDAKAKLRSTMSAIDPGMIFGAFESPWRPLGTATIALELVTDLGGTAPDVIVIPTGTGGLVVGIYQGFNQLRDAGVIDELPTLVAVQAAGCAPIAEAVTAKTPIEPIEAPDTICGELEIPNPRGGQQVQEAIEQTNGTAVMVTDQKILDAGILVSRQTGIECGPDAAAGPAGTKKLAAADVLENAASVVIISTGTGGADVLRNHASTAGL